MQGTCTYIVCMYSPYSIHIFRACTRASSNKRLLKNAKKHASANIKISLDWHKSQLSEGAETIEIAAADKKI